jgi:hypothetical protein
MCYNSNLFYVSYFNFLCNYLLKFVVHEMNSEMFKSEIMILTEREKTDMVDADVVVCSIL